MVVYLLETVPAKAHFIAQPTGRQQVRVAEIMLLLRTGYSEAVVTLGMTTSSARVADNQHGTTLAAARSVGGHGRAS